VIKDDELPGCSSSYDKQRSMKIAPQLGSYLFCSLGVKRLDAALVRLRQQVTNDRVVRHLAQEVV